MMFCHDQGPRAKVATDGMITTMIMALEVTMTMTTTLTTAMTMIVMMMAMAVIFVIVNTAALLIPLIINIQSLRTAVSRSVQLRRGCCVSLDARLCFAVCIYT